MANNVLASMVISLGLDSQGVTTGIGNANKSLLQFQGSADKLKGVDLSTLRASFDKQITALATLKKQAREYQKALNFTESEAEMKALNRQLDEVYAEMNRIKNLGRTNLGGFGTGAASAAKDMDKLRGSAGMVNMEFARIVQDAPYAVNSFGAIANNIQQLTTNFGQLRQQSGSTGTALKATLASMLSGVGLLNIGISGLTAAYVAYQMWSQRSAKATKEAAGAMKSAEQAAEEYINSLSSLARARATGERDAQKELVSLKLLYERTQDVSLSMQDRVKAVDELQKQYPDYFKNLKDEDILAGRASEAYAKLSKSILEYAQAQASLELITKKAQQREVNKLQVRDLQQQLREQELAIKTAEELKQAQDEANASMGRGTGSVLGARKLNNLKTAYEETEQAIRNLLAENGKLTSEMALLAPGATPALFKDDETGKKIKEQRDYMKELVESWNLATKQAVLFGASYDELGVKADLLKTTMVGLLQQGASPENSQIQSLVATYELFTSKTVPQAKTAIERFANTNLSKLRLELTATAQSFQALPMQLQPMSEQMKAFFDKMAEDAQAAMGMIEIEAEQMTSFMQGAISNAIATFADAFGQLAVTGDFESFLDSIIATVAEFAGNFGKLLIGAGVAALTFEKLLANPVAAIAAGAALVAASGAVKAFISKGPSGSGGGFSMSGVGGYNSPSPNSGFNTSYEGPDQIELFIRDDKLVAFIDKSLYRVGRRKG